MIGSIIGSIIKGVAPLALNMGSQIIKTKIEEKMRVFNSSWYKNEVKNTVAKEISITRSDFVRKK